MTQPKNPAPETPRGDGGGGGKESVKPVLPMPAGIDPDWRERIDLAKRAYQDGKKLREGKPIMFRTSWPLRLGDGSEGLMSNGAMRIRCRRCPART